MSAHDRARERGLWPARAGDGKAGTAGHAFRTILGIQLLAFALSFDEIIVTTFTVGSGVETLPIWILNNLFRPNQAPVVSVIAVVLVIVSIIPIYIAQRIAGAEKVVR